MRSAWNEFVSKIFKEGKQKNPNYQFKNALKDASNRKSEMGQTSTISTPMPMSSKGKKVMKGTKHKKSHKKGSKKSRTKKNKKH
jgi:formate-dependent phosphoribosylglycinamide formyltransferase (GAR transformylase)